MRGHGDTVVGNSIKTAVFHAIYTEVNAHLESDAIHLGGKITFLNEVEAAKIGEQNDKLVDPAVGDLEDGGGGGTEAAPVEQHLANSSRSPPVKSLNGSVG